MSSHLSNLSIGGYIALTLVPVIALAAWLIAIYHSDRNPEWRHGPQEQPPMIGPGGVELGRALPGQLPVPVEPTAQAEDRPRGPERS